MKFQYDSPIPFTVLLYLFFRLLQGREIVGSNNKAG